METKLIKQIMGQAIAEKARTFTYPLIIDDKSIGTAISIKLGEHYFLATASHIIKNADEIKVITHNQITNPITNFADKYCDNNVDLGLLEILSSDSEYFDDFLSYDGFNDAINVENENPTMVIGYPSQYCNTEEEIMLSQKYIAKFTRCDSVTFHSNTLSHSKWPIDGLPDEYGNHKTLIKGQDILVEFLPKSEITPFTSKTAGTANPAIKCPPLHPCGMSGGGIWLSQLTEVKEKINIPDPRLIGIQLSWYKKRNILRGIKINAFLDFVKEKYPDINILCKSI